MLKWLVNSGWWLANRHSRESRRPRCCLPGLRAGIASVKSSWRPAGAIGSIAVLFALVLLTACTDYVSQIEDRYGEWNVGQVYVPAEESSSSVAFPMSSWSGGGAGAIGSITDTRDGQTYKTVTIGTQTWMAQNLNYETADSYCYNDTPSNCTKYGRLYTWAAAMDSVGTWSANGKDCGYKKTCTPTYPVRGVCPTGWHLPTKAEFETLFTVVGGPSTAGTKLKSTTGWNSGGNGTDAYSFSALPAGGRDYNVNYNDEGYSAGFWCSTESGSYYAYYVLLRYSIDDAGLYYNFKYYGFSVRCVKD